MGIQGLLTFVKPASKSVHLSDLKGQIVAIDSYCWIHKGAFGCAEKLGKGEETDAYVQYCFKFLDMLRSFRITPIMVFDGRNLPAKRLTEDKRREVRVSAKKKAVECLRLGKLSEARMNFIKAVDVTPEMALKLIKACRSRGIDCIVAPYEADAQLAYLNQKGIVDFIITEDSDLLVFGCKKVLFKLDLSASGTLVESDQLFQAMNEKPESYSLDKFRHMCILSGCDYLDSLPGVGLKKALKFVKANSKLDIYEVLTKIPTSLNLKNVVVSEEYKENFMIADATFRHQLVFDPLNRQLVALTDPETTGTKPEHCCNAGDMMDQKVAFQLALGNLSPDDLKVMDSWCPDRDIPPFAFKISIWSKSYQIPQRRKEKKLSEKIPNTKGMNVSCDVKLLQIQENTFEEERVKRDIEKMYFEEPPSKKICMESSQKENEITSPVLNKKRIFVKSRFFSQDNIKINKKINLEEFETNEEIKLEKNYNGTKNDDNVQIVMSDDEKSKIEINEIKFETTNGDYAQNFESDTTSKSQENIEISRIKIKTSESLISESVSQTTTADKVISNNNNKSEIMEKLNEMKKTVSTISTRSTVCRRPGLSRKNSTSKFTVDKNQPTLSRFFSKKT